MTKVLITGAAGFIGSHLTKKLLSLGGYKIRAFLRPQSDLCRIRSVLNRIEVFHGNLDRLSDIEKGMKGADILIHLASILKRGRPEDYQRINIDASKNFFRLAVKNRVKKVIYLSSLGVMRSTDEPHIYTEEEPTDPATWYGKSKVMIEQFALGLMKQKRTRFTILRPPAVYGEEDNFDRGVIMLVDLVARGLFVPFHDMKNFMSIIYIGNLIDAVVTSMKNRKSDNKIYFIADREILTMGELISAVRRLAGAPKIPVRFPTFLARGAEKIIETCGRIFNFLPAFPENSVDDMVRHYMCSSRLFQTETKWNPPFTLQEGLKRTVGWYLKERP